MYDKEIIKTETVELGYKIDKFGKIPLNLTTMIGLAVTSFFIYYDLTNYIYISPVLKSIWHIEDSLIAYGASLSVLGNVIGALCIPIVADYYGRKPALLMSIMILAVGSILAASSTNMTQMILFRFLTAIGIGAELVLVAVYVGEMSPKSKRGKYTSLLMIFGVIGLISTGPISFFLVQHNHISLIVMNDIQGWQIVMALPGIIGFVLVPFRASMPESPRWLIIKGKIKEANKLLLSLGIEPLTTTEGQEQQQQRLYHDQGSRTSSTKTKLFSFFQSLLNNKILTHRILLFVGMWSMSFIPIFASLMFSVLFVNQGYSISQSIAITTFGNLGFAAGAVISFLLSDKVERKYQVAIAGCVLGISFVLRGLLIHDYNGLIYSSFLGFAAHFWLIINLAVYTTESFPTHIRASIFGLINAVANAIAMIGPILIVVLQSFGFVNSLIYMSLFLFGGVSLILLFGPKTVDKSLEELTSIDASPTNPGITFDTNMKISDEFKNKKDGDGYGQSQ